MPARPALRPLTLGFDLVVFLWRRYSSVSRRSAPATDGPGEALNQRRVVSVPADNDAEDARAQDLFPERTQTVNFGLDGQNYAIDLSDQSAAELREMLGRYVAAGRRVGQQTGTAKIAPARARAGQPAPPDGQDAASLRQWARAHGHRIRSRPDPLNGSTGVRPTATSRRLEAELRDDAAQRHGQVFIGLVE